MERSAISLGFKGERIMYRVLVVVQLLIFLFAHVTARAQSGISEPACVSEWFEVNSFPGGPSPSQVLSLCEETRAELFRVWVGKDEVKSWQPRCKIVLHPTRAHYLRKVGTGAGQTSGCSSIQLHNGKVVHREIDLMLDEAGELVALPHELTHVVLADLLKGRQPPHWLDEGIAMLADTTAKRHLHMRDCYQAMAAGKAMTTSQILTLDSFSSPEQMPAFYGQSLMLVKMLAEHSSPASIVRFANDSIDYGTTVALKRHYNIDGIDGLERAWRDYALRHDPSKEPMAIVSVRFKP
jgi:hypothetical protein